MDKTKLKNKAIQNLVEDAKDGRLKKENQEYAKQLSKELQDKAEACNYEYNGVGYSSLRDIPVPFTQANEWLRTGKIKKCK